MKWEKLNSCCWESLAKDLTVTVWEDPVVGGWEISISFPNKDDCELRIPQTYTTAYSAKRGAERFLRRLANTLYLLDCRGEI